MPVLKGVDFRSATANSSPSSARAAAARARCCTCSARSTRPDAGEIHFEGNRIDNLAARSRDVLRNEHFGMIFQFYHLLPELSTLENVLAPIMIRYGVFSYWRHKREHVERAKATARHGRPLATASRTSRASSPAAKCSAPPSPAP